VFIVHNEIIKRSKVVFKAADRH